MHFDHSTKEQSYINTLPNTPSLTPSMGYKVWLHRGSFSFQENS